MAVASPSAPDDPWGDPEATALWRDLIAIHPTNLEDPVRGRYEKPRYGAAVDRIARSARAWGLDVRRYDPTEHPGAEEYRGIPRPNLILDLDRGAPETVLVLAHYDVVPVPAEQRARWHSPPEALTPRADGRWYGRGASDDLGCGVVGGLLALKRLAAAPSARRNVRLLVCCDEETGGEGGIEALKKHDAALPPGDPGRFLLGEVVLIPDGSPHATAASSGLAFVDASFDRAVPLTDALAYADRLDALGPQALARRSGYPSPDYPDGGAPAPVITGRATLTRFDWSAPDGPPSHLALVAARAETDASNYIPEAVSLAVRGSPEARARWAEAVRRSLPSGFRLASGGATGLAVPAEAELWQILGAGGHAGSPHRARDPVPVALAVLRQGVAAGLVDGSRPGVATFAVDLRLIPEAALATELPPFLDPIRTWIETRMPTARVEAPPARCRGGYALSMDEPHLNRLATILTRTLGAHGIFGEYGGTDASSLVGVAARSGGPLPAIVFGSMDPTTHIHDAEENADPRLLRGVSESIRAFVADA